MSTRPALVRLVADASDQVVHDYLASQGFQVFPPLVTRTLRRYLAHRQFRDVEIEIFRDEDWAGPGLRVRIQARVLVHPVQQALERTAQTLLAPRADAPLRRFQLGPHADDLPGSWTVTAPGDVTVYAAGLYNYLRDVAIPWLKNTESIDAVLDHLTELGQAETREQLVKALRRDGHRA